MIVIRRWLAVVPAVALCAACTSSVSGAPAVDSSGPRLPPRPRVLTIDGLDPCGALTAAQLRNLGVALYGASKPDGKRGPSCDWDHYPSEPIENYSLDV